MKAYVDHYISQLPYSPAVVEQLQVSIGETIIPASSYYSYPLFFTEFFPEIEKEKLERLCTASFFIFMFVSLSDRYLDIKKNTRQHLDNLNLSFIFYDEGVKLLEQLFPKESRFWDTWNKRRHTFLSVGIFNDIHTGFSRETYYKIAAEKSELGKLAIDTLYYLSGINDQAKYSALLLSHDYFSVGFQLLDDIEDFSRDLKHRGRTNFIFNEMIKEGINTEDSNSVNEAYFKFDLLEEAAALSIAYFDKAKEAVSGLAVKQDSQWLFAIEYKKKKISIFQKEIQSYKAAQAAV